MGETGYMAHIPQGPLLVLRVFRRAARLRSMTMWSEVRELQAARQDDGVTARRIEQALMTWHQFIT
jgi:hypothetical protein